MHLSAEHDAGEEGEEKAFKDAQEGQDEGKGAGHDGVTPIKVTPHAAKEEPAHHAQTIYGHAHDVQLEGGGGEELLSYYMWNL